MENHQILRSLLSVLLLFYIIINKAIEVVSGYADYAYKAGISDKWVKQISEEIRYRVELVK